jgi:hypothetical protein
MKREKSDIKKGLGKNAQPTGIFHGGNFALN